MKTSENINRQNKIRTVILLLLFLTSSFAIYYDLIGSVLTIGLWLVAMVIIVTMGHIRFDNNVVGVFGLLSALMLASILYGDNPRNVIMILASFVIVFLFSGTVSFQEFKKEYVDVMYFLALFSIALFLIYTFIPQMQSINTVWNGKISCIYFFSYRSDLFRNYGMFWEPGAYQTFLALAAMFCLSEKILNVNKFIVLLAALVTTFSTVGAISMALIISKYLISRDASKRTTKIGLALLLLCAGFFLFNFTELISSTQIFWKVESFFAQEQYRSAEFSLTSSAAVRYFAIVKPFEAFLEKPITGWGTVNLEKQTFLFTRGMNTCTFINWFAAYGVFYGIIMVLGYVKLSRKLAMSAFERILVFILFFCITMSESYTSNAFFVLLALYGYQEMELKSKDVPLNDSEALREIRI